MFVLRARCSPTSIPPSRSARSSAPATATVTAPTAPWPTTIAGRRSTPTSPGSRRGSWSCATSSRRAGRCGCTSISAPCTRRRSCATGSSAAPRSSARSCGCRATAPRGAAGRGWPTRPCSSTRAAKSGCGTPRIRCCARASRRPACRCTSRRRTPTAGATAIGPSAAKPTATTPISAARWGACGPTARRCSATRPSARRRRGIRRRKPEKLLERIVRASSEPGALVVDPFCGSGTTLVAAASQGRRFVGSDIGARAIATTAARLQAASIAFDLVRPDVAATESPSQRS